MVAAELLTRQRGIMRLRDGNNVAATRPTPWGSPRPLATVYNPTDTNFSEN